MFRRSDDHYEARYKRIKPGLLPGALFTLALLTVSALLAGQAAAQAPVVVRYWHAMGDAESAALEQQIAEFEAAQPDVAIEATQFPYEDYRDALLRAIVAGTAPDVARLDILWVPEFADIGALEALDETVPGFADVAPRFFAGSLQTNVWQGHTWGLPLEANTQVLLVNRAHLEAAGLAVPETMNAFTEAACALTDEHGRYGFALAGTDFWAVAPLFYAQGGQLTDAEMTRASGALNSPASVRAFQTVVDLYAQGCLSPNLLGDGVGAAEGHATGRYGMITGDSSFLRLYARQFPDFKTHMALIPAGAGASASVVAGESAVMLTDSTHKAAALAWMNYLVSDDYQLAMAQLGVLPTLRSLADDPTLPDAFGVFMRQLETARARTMSVYWYEIDILLNVRFQAMLRGEVTVESALNQAAAEIDALLAKGGR